MSKSLNELYGYEPDPTIKSSPGDGNLDDQLGRRELMLQGMAKNLQEYRAADIEEALLADAKEHGLPVIYLYLQLYSWQNDGAKIDHMTYLFSVVWRGFWEKYLGDGKWGSLAASVIAEGLSPLVVTSTSLAVPMLAASHLSYANSEPIDVTNYTREMLKILFLNSPFAVFGPAVATLWAQCDVLGLVASHFACQEMEEKGMHKAAQRGRKELGRSALYNLFQDGGTIGLSLLFPWYSWITVPVGTGLGERVEEKVWKSSGISHMSGLHRTNILSMSSFAIILFLFMLFSVYPDEYSKLSNLTLSAPAWVDGDSRPATPVEYDGSYNAYRVDQTPGEDKPTFCLDKKAFVDASSNANKQAMLRQEYGQDFRNSTLISYPLVMRDRLYMHTIETPQGKNHTLVSYTALQTTDALRRRIATNPHLIFVSVNNDDFTIPLEGGFLGRNTDMCIMSSREYYSLQTVLRDKKAKAR